MKNYIYTLYGSNPQFSKLARFSRRVDAHIEISKLDTLVNFDTLNIKILNPKHLKVLQRGQLLPKALAKKIFLIGCLLNSLNR